MVIPDPIWEPALCTDTLNTNIESIFGMRMINTLNGATPTGQVPVPPPPPPLPSRSGVEKVKHSTPQLMTLDEAIDFTGLTARIVTPMLPGLYIAGDKRYIDLEQYTFLYSGAAWVFPPVYL